MRCLRFNNEFVQEAMICWTTKYGLGIEPSASLAGKAIASTWNCRCGDVEIQISFVTAVVLEKCRSQTTYVLHDGSEE